MFTTADLIDADAAAAIAALGVDEPEAAPLEVVGHPSGSPATAALHRVRGPRGSLFCKVLQHVRHWPGLHHLPPEVAAGFAEQLPWRAELELWEPWHLATLPVGLRAPTLHALVELPDERVAVWMEDVWEVAAAWDLPCHERAAYLLGRWNARTSASEVVARSALPTGFALRMYVENAVALRGLGALTDDDLWSHPWLAEAAGLRSDLRALAGEIPALLDRMDGFGQCLPHGDASPQNLLVPSDGPATFVVIDVSFRSPLPLGFDLGQLLVGLVHAGELPAARVPELAAAILPAYLRGLHAEGVTGRDEAARDAFATGVLLRSGFDGFRWDLLERSDDADRHAFDKRVVLARAIVELYRSTR